MPLWVGENRRWRILFRTTFCQPLLPAPLGFPFFRLPPDARLLIIPPALQFSEQPFTGKFFLGDLESFLDIIIENFDFHIWTTFDFPLPNFQLM